MESDSEVKDILVKDDEKPFDFITILRSEDVAPGKRIVLVDGTHRLAEQVEKEAAARENRKPAKPPHPTRHTVTTHPLRADHLLDDLFAALSTAKHSYAIHGALRDGSKTRSVRRRKALFDDARHAWLALDIDKLACDFTDGAAVAAFVRDRLPEEFRNRRCAWNLTPSHILKNGKSRIRLYFALDRAVTLAETKTWLLRATIADGLAIDHALWNSRVQENFLHPALDRGVTDPFPNRWGILPGEIELVAVPKIDTSAVAAKSERRGLPATPGVVIDDAAYLAYALPRLFAERTVDRIDSDGRQNSFRFLAQDFQDRAFSQDVCEAACLHFFFHSEETADALREALDEKGVARAEKIVAEVTALGEARDDVWLGREGTIDESDIVSQIHQGYEGAQNAFGCKTFADEDASADFAAVDLADEEEDDRSPRNAFDAWSGDPLNPRLSAALVTALTTSGADRLKARACVALAEMPAFAGAADDSLDWIKETVAKAEAKPGAGLPAPFYVDDFDKLPPRELIYGGDYYRRYVSATTSPGGRGKSALLIAEAVGMATGRDLFGRPAKRLRVLHWNLEDPLDEIRLRVGAALKFHGLTSADLGENLFVLSGRDRPLKIASAANGKPAIDRKAIAELIAMLRALRIDVLQLDPFVSLHLCSGNDDAAVDLVIKELGRVAGVQNCAVMVANHTRKPERNGDGAVTSMDSRGSSAFVDGVRSQRLLNPMKDKEAALFGIEPEQTWRYLKLEDGKGNLRPKSGGLWLKLESQGLDNATADYEASNVQVIVGWQAPGVPGRGSDVQERIGAWMAGATAEGEVKSLAEGVEATGAERHNFRANVMGGRDRVRTTHGVLEYVSKRGQSGGLLRLTDRPGAWAAADEPADDDGSE